MLNDITEALSKSSSEAGKKLLLTIHHSMSDRAGTEKKFNELVEDLLNKALLVYRDVEDQLQKEDAGVVIHLTNWCCGLHNMVDIATLASAASLSAEKGHFQGPGLFSNGKS
jgi:hypothetical protein